jgi:hypothetical protein
MFKDVSIPKNYEIEFFWLAIYLLIWGWMMFSQMISHWMTWRMYGVWV